MGMKNMTTCKQDYWEQRTKYIILNKSKQAAAKLQRALLAKTEHCVKAQGCLEVKSLTADPASQYRPQMLEITILGHQVYQSQECLDLQSIKTPVFVRLQEIIFCLFLFKSKHQQTRTGSEYFIRYNHVMN